MASTGVYISYSSTLSAAGMLMIILYDIMYILIVTFTYSGICKRWLAPVCQELRITPRAPDLIRLPFGWPIHYAISI